MHLTEMNKDRDYMVYTQTRQACIIQFPDHVGIFSYKQDFINITKIRGKLSSSFLILIIKFH